MKKIKEFAQRFRLTETKKDRAILMTCIGIAFVFWVLVKLSQVYTSECEILLDYDLPKDKVLRETPPRKIVATIKGNGWNLFNEYRHNADREVMLEIVEDRNYLDINELKNTINRFLDNNDLEVQQLSPNFIMVNLDKKTFKKVPIILVDSSTVADQHFLTDSIRLSQDSALISGPESVVNQFDHWKTTTLNFKNLNENIDIPLLLRIPENRQLDIEPKKVTASIAVEKYTEKKFFVPVVIKNAKDSIKIFPKQIQLSITVGVSAYDSISAKDFEAEIDLAKAVEGSNNIPINITKQPVAAQRIHFSPKAVEYFILKQQE
ncbi:MAG: CdaR family protein [Bacteroidota bacterium]